MWSCVLSASQGANLGKGGSTCMSLVHKGISALMSECSVMAMERQLHDRYTAQNYDAELSSQGS